MRVRLSGAQSTPAPLHPWNTAVQSRAWTHDLNFYNTARPPNHPVSCYKGRGHGWRWWSYPQTGMCQPRPVFPNRSILYQSRHGQWAECPRSQGTFCRRVWTCLHQSSPKTERHKLVQKDDWCFRYFSHTMAASVITGRQWAVGRINPLTSASCWETFPHTTGQEASTNWTWTHSQVIGERLLALPRGTCRVLTLWATGVITKV